MSSNLTPPLYWLLRFGGMLPNNTTYDKYFTATTTILGAFCMFVILSSRNFGRDFYFSAYQMNDVMFVLSALLLLLKVHLTKNNVLTLFTKCLLEVETLRDEQRVKRYELTVAVTFCSLLLGRILTVPLESHDHSRDMTYNVSMGLIYVPTLLHIVLVRHLAARISDINDQLRDAVQAMRDQSYPTNELMRRLTAVFRRHVYFRGIRGQINSYFGFYNVITFTSRLTFIVWLMYNIISTLTDPAKSLKLISCFEFTCVVTAFCAQCDVCHRCSEQACRTVRIALSSVDRNTPLPIINEIEDISLTMFNKRVQFSAGGIFTLDRGLITKATIVSVTCLIIAVQLTNLKVPYPTDIPNNTVVNFNNSFPLN